MITEITRKKRYFFVLCKKLGYDKIVAKERAKKRFQLKSFSEVKIHQLTFLIAKLEAEKEIREGKHT